MPAKPTKYGFKVFMLADSKNWYIYAYEIYKGNIARKEDEQKDIGETAKVFRRLTSDLENEGYQIYADKFFSNIRSITSLR